jgi:hypothetical protein
MMAGSGKRAAFRRRPPLCCSGTRAGLGRSAPSARLPRPTAARAAATAPRGAAPPLELPHCSWRSCRRSCATRMMQQAQLAAAPRGAVPGCRGCCMRAARGTWAPGSDSVGKRCSPGEPSRAAPRQRRRRIHGRLARALRAAGCQRGAPRRSPRHFIAARSWASRRGAAVASSLHRSDVVWRGQVSRETFVIGLCCECLEPFVWEKAPRDAATERGVAARWYRLATPMTRAPPARRKRHDARSVPPSGARVLSAV